MIRRRTLMIAAGLFAMATAANAQSISPAALQRLAGQDATVITLPAVPTPLELAQLEVQAEQLANQPLLPTWLTQAVEQGMTKLQKLRSAASTGKPMCCEVVQPGIVKGSGVSANDQCFKDVTVRVQATQTSNSMLPTSQCTATNVIRHLVQQVPCCGIKDFVQLKVTTTPPCCCAKACACCETCKPKTTAAVQVCPMPVPMSAPTPAWQVQSVTRVVSATPAPLPRFETPDLEVHCEKMTHRGDTVTFEGNVMLLSKKHAQPIRVNAQRVVLNVKDGSYTVESGRPVATPASSFGVLRTSVSSEQCLVPPPIILPMPRPDHTQRPGYVMPPLAIQVVPVPPSSMPQVIPIGAATWQRNP